MAKKKQKKQKIDLNSEQGRIDAIINLHANQKDIYGRKVKGRNQVIMLDDTMLVWRQKLMKRSSDLTTMYMLASLLLGGLLIFFFFSIVTVFLFAALTIGAMVGIYLLYIVKQRYITAVTNSLQIPAFNKMIALIKQVQAEEGIKDLSDITGRNDFKKYESYIVAYLSYKKSDDLDEFVNFLQKIPEQLRYNLAFTMKDRFTPLANRLFNTDKIKVHRQPLNPNRQADGSMIDVSLSAIARDGKKKRGGRAKNVREAIRELEEMSESKAFVKGAKFKQTAPWYMKSFTDEQLDAMLEMNMTPRQMSKWQTQRMMKASIPFFGALIGYGINIIFPFKYAGMLPVGGIGLSLAYYIFQIREINSSLSSWRFKRRMAFSQLTQLIVPYLFLMKSHGGSLTEVFRSVSNRLEDPNDRALVVRLIRDMQNNPNSDAPFVNFAQSFTDDPSAVIFMTAVNRSAQTKGDNTVIEDLAERAQNQLLEKVGQVAKVKEGRMVILPTYVTVIGMLINLIMVMSAMIYQMSSAM